MAKRKSYPEGRRGLTKEDIFSTKLPEGEFYIEALNAWLWIRGMSAGWMAKNNKKIINAKGKPDYSKAMDSPPHVVAYCVLTGEGGERMFTGSQEDLDRINALPGGVVNEIVDAAYKLSGLRKEKKDLGEWLKETHPDILEEFESIGEKYSPVDEAEENFT